jgi:hypothetical protein
VDESGDDERRGLVEVYNHPQQPAVEDVLQIEPLATWHLWIVLTAIWSA